MKVKRLNNIITALIIILLIVLFSLIYGIIRELKNEVKETVTLDTIENYQYILTDNDTEYYKENFKELKKILESETIDKEEYATGITKLFLIDLYSLSSAINKNDVGGVQFVVKEYQETFIKKAKDTIYNTVENNMYEDRKQTLPNVKEVSIDSVKKEDTQYKVVASITYDEDLGYATSVEVTIEENNAKLEITALKEL